jgi:PEP-CTERM motif
MAEYLASIRGPGSPDKLPFKLRSRPTSAASTNLVYTEYDVPRGGSYDLMTTRGDRRYAWPHDILLDPNGKYAWYTDHFTNILGRLDIKTGEVKESVSGGPSVPEPGTGMLLGVGLIGLFAFLKLRPPRSTSL